MSSVGTPDHLAAVVLAGGGAGSLLIGWRGGRSGASPEACCSRATSRASPDGRARPWATNAERRSWRSSPQARQDIPADQVTSQP